jgi:hypothetical protein
MKKFSKKQSSMIMYFLLTLASTFIILYLAGVFDKKPMIVQMEAPADVNVVPVDRWQRHMEKERPDIRDSREFRGPPLKIWKPGQTQQIGLLFDSEANDTLPLYGKEVFGRRDSYNYYTTTGSPGSNNIYPVPISYDNRDCMDSSVGCRELYGGERLSILGKDNEYEAKIYRTEHFY